MSFEMRNPHCKVSWKPDILIFIDDPKIWTASIPLISGITHPSGSIFAFTFRDSGIVETECDLGELLAPLKEQCIPVRSTVIRESDFLHDAELFLKVLKSGSSCPNTLFLTLGDDEQNDETIRKLVTHAGSSQLSVMILYQYKASAYGMQQDVNLWLRDESPNWRLAMLVALQLQMNWKGRLHVITASTNLEDTQRLYSFLERLGEHFRLPSMAEFHVRIGEFREILETAPRADLNIFGLAKELSFPFIRKAVAGTKSSCIFIGDSGQENALV